MDDLMVDMLVALMDYQLERKMVARMVYERVD